MPRLITKNATTTRFETLSSNLVSVLHTLAIALEETDSAFCQSQCFAAARLVQRTARQAGCLNRFNTEVEKDYVATVFSDHGYKHSIYQREVLCCAGSTKSDGVAEFLEKNVVPSDSGCRIM